MSVIETGKRVLGVGKRLLGVITLEPQRRALIGEKEELFAIGSLLDNAEYERLYVVMDRLVAISVIRVTEIAFVGAVASYVAWNLAR